MSLTTRTPVAASGADVPTGGPTDPSGGARRRWRGPLLLALAFVVAVAAVVLTQGRTSQGAALDPDNPSPSGAQALARVLTQDGIDIDVVRSARALDDATLDASTTVVVSSPEALGRNTVRDLEAHLGPAHLVVLGPGVAVARLLGFHVEQVTVAVGRGRDADCADPALTGLRIEVDEADAYQGAGCFGGHGGVLITGTGTGTASGTASDTQLVGADQAFSNGQIERADDAAVALRLLGARPHLVWYVPNPADIAAGDGVSVGSLLPRFLGPSLFLVLLAAVVLMLWRGRRLGALAVEPLPVVVKAIETTRSRGRLYRASGDRAHAAAVLRRATALSITRRLRLAPTLPPSDLVHEVARHTGRSGIDLGALLVGDGTPPASDRELITLARELAELDREVRRT